MAPSFWTTVNDMLVNRRPRARALYEAAMASHQRGDRERALLQARAAVALDPGLEDARDLLTALVTAAGNSFRLAP